MKNDVNSFLITPLTNKNFQSYSFPMHPQDNYDRDHRSRFSNQIFVTFDFVIR